MQSPSSEAPEIYTGNASRIAKYRRLIGMLLLIRLPILTANRLNAVNMWNLHSSIPELKVAFWMGIAVLYAL